MTRRQFERLLEETLEKLPGEFRRRLENVEVVVQRRPDPELLDELGVPEDETLFGLYQGVPLPEREETQEPRMPDRILIFQEPIEEACASRAEVEAEVRRTLLHEVAHHFGLDEARLQKLGWD
ncbi:MAG: metallopeptidase family protein [Acidobacteriota bacterium]